MHPPPVEGEGLGCTPPVELNPLRLTPPAVMTVGGA